MIVGRDKLEIIQNPQTASHHCSVEAAWKQNICESLGLMSWCTLTAFLEGLPSRQGASGTCVEAGKMMIVGNEVPETSALAAVANWSCGIYICDPTWRLLWLRESQPLSLSLGEGEQSSQPYFLPPCHAPTGPDQTVRAYPRWTAIYFKCGPIYHHEQRL